MKTGRDSLYVKKIVDLAQYRDDFQQKKILAYSELCPSERIALFGSTVVPIHVPLAPGETPEEYESRFLDWLERERVTLRELEAHSNAHQERMFRIRFANLNTTSVESYGGSPLEKYDGGHHSKRERSPDPKELPPSKRFPASSPSDARQERTAGSSQTNSSMRGSEDCQLIPPRAGASAIAVVGAYTACGCPVCTVEAVRVLESSHVP